jgi:hypothetical protein
MYNYFILGNDIEDIVENHNENFESDETNTLENEQ